MVPKEGLEPSWYRYRQILSLYTSPQIAIFYPFFIPFIVDFF